MDGAIGAVRTALAGGLNWKELKRLIKTEREAGNPVASIIHSLELEQNRITLLLSNFLDEEEGNDEALTRPATKVDLKDCHLDLSCQVWSLQTLLVTPAWLAAHLAYAVSLARRTDGLSLDITRLEFKTLNFFDLQSHKALLCCSFQEEQVSQKGM